MPSSLHPSPTDRADDELALVTLAGRGDAAALALLYEAHGSAAFRLAYRVLGNRALAEDVVRDVFVAVGRSEGRQQAHDEGVESWLLRRVRAGAVEVLCRRPRVTQGAQVLDTPDHDLSA